MNIGKKGAIAQSGATMKFPIFTGEMDIVGSEKVGYARLKGNGVLTLSRNRYDLTIVGAGMDGQSGKSAANRKGGDGGKAYICFNKLLSGDIEVTVGVQSGEPSTFGDYCSDDGITGGIGGEGAGNNTAPAYPGEAGIYAFFDSNFMRISGGGGGGTYISGSTAMTRNGALGGEGGGGNGGGASISGSTKKAYAGEAGAPNTGGGGGGGGYVSSATVPSGGKGGSGVIYIRWGY